jgi:hypothetical protein
MRNAIVGTMLAVVAGVSAGCAQWEPLFDGHSLNGWKQVGEANWCVEDGMIVGTQAAPDKTGELLTEKQYQDFELECTFKVDFPANSGIWFRYEEGREGYQFDILEYAKPVAYTGTIYCPGKLFLAINKDKSLFKYDDWNHAYVKCVGDEIISRLNGRLVGDVHDATYAGPGRIGFQVHAGKDFTKMKIMVKEIRVRDLARRAMSP